MRAQGVLPFRYEAEPTNSGMTALAGLPAYLELAAVSGKQLLPVHRHRLGVCSGHGFYPHPGVHRLGGDPGI